MPDLGYVRITPERLCALCIVEAARDIDAAEQTPVRWFFAILMLHRALNCALVAALRGSAGIGAYPKRGRALWLAWFEESRTTDLPPPTWDRVEEFAGLLARAQDPNEPEMQGRHIQLTEQQQDDLRRLNSFRADIEHVKPRHWSLEVGGLPRIRGTAAAVISQLISTKGVGKYLEEDELEAALSALQRVQHVAERYPSIPPANA